MQCHLWIEGCSAGETPAFSRLLKLRLTEHSGRITRCDAPNGTQVFTETIVSIESLTDREHKRFRLQGVSSKTADRVQARYEVAVHFAVETVGIEESLLTDTTYGWAVQQPNSADLAAVLLQWRAAVAG